MDKRKYYKKCVLENFKNNNIKSILKNFATNFKENVNKIIHKCNIKTLYNVEITPQNSIFMENTNEQEIFNILNKLNIKKKRWT